MIVQLAGPAISGEAAAFDINNLINALSNTANKIFGQPDTTAEEKSLQLQTVLQTYAAQLQQMARQNQTALLTVGGVIAAGLVAFTIFKKK